MPEAVKKVVLITGASASIGKRCAERLQASGWRVYGASRHIVECLPDARFETISMDVTDAVSIKRGVAAILEREGRLDAVINCAGYALAGAVEDTSLDEARLQLETNFLGSASVCREVLPIMRRQRAGAIVNVASIGGMVPMPFQAYYSASKAALTAWSRALRLEVASFGVHVVLVEPGDHCTEFTERRHLAADATRGHNADAFARALSVMRSDEQAGSSPDPVARLVEKILAESSPRASYLVGPWFQRFAVSLRVWLPAQLFDWGLRKYYRLP